jgi:uncharacterized protein YjiS (DUF1127 family)
MSSMEGAMCEPQMFRLSMPVWSRMTIKQQLHVRRLIIAQARLARARALRKLLRGLQSMVQRAAAAFAGGWRAVALWHKRRRAVRELRALDDRSLRDIGLGRSEIESAVRGRSC